MNIKDGRYRFSVEVKLYDIPTGASLRYWIVREHGETFKSAGFSIGTWERAWSEYVEQRERIFLPGPDGYDYVPVFLADQNSGSKWCWCRKDGTVLVDSENHIVHPFWVKFHLRVVGLEEEVPQFADWDKRSPSKLVWAQKNLSRWQFGNADHCEVIRN